MQAVRIEALALAAPGLDNWADARRALTGELPYDGGELPSYAARILNPNERRRITPTIRLALGVAEEACSSIEVPAAEVPSVFATSCGDRKLTVTICESLCTAPPQISPTQFHNSVHNAPAGYWAIAKNSFAASTTVSAGPGTFAAGLLEAAVQAQVEDTPVLLVAYDYPAPDPLDKVVPVRLPFAVAMVLAPHSGNSRQSALATVQLEIVGDGQEHEMSSPGLESLRRANPIARSLPLLEAVARGAWRQVTLPYVAGRHLSIHVERFAQCADASPAADAESMQCTIAKT